jgi:hypothetical protein
MAELLPLFEKKRRPRLKRNQARYTHAFASCDKGFAASFGVTTPAVPALPYEVLPQRTTNSSTTQVFQEVNNLDVTLLARGLF